MKTNQKIRSIVTMMVIFFAVTTTSCKKEESITPTTPTAPVVPVTPPTPVIPAVSMKPRFISTKENNQTVRKQEYVYDVQGKLIKYISQTPSAVDSVLIFSNSIAFKNVGPNVSNSLVFNADKTFKSLFSANTQIDFVNSQTKLSSITQTRVNNTPITAAQFQYTNNNLSAIGAEARFDYNYYDNLPYQKGINEMHLFLKPVQYYKLLEQENLTTTTIYNKLLRQEILNFGNRIETHEYTYVFDTNNRVTQMTDVITNTTNGTQRTLVSTISY